jgi:hypothetical protein
MRILLLWRHLDGETEGLAPEPVARSLHGIFSPLFEAIPDVRIRQSPAGSLVFLQLPVRGWIPPFFEEDERTWAVAAEYPMDARAVLEASGIRVGEGGVLPVLGRSLQDGPASLLRAMAPPFSLVWSPKQTGQIFLQNDGLGQAQLFEYRDNRLWAVTNRILALRALNVPLEPEPEDWAVRMTLPRFPGDRTGYKRTRFLGPGSQVRLGTHEVTRTSHDVLREWVNPGELSQAESLELARASILQQVRAALPLFEQPTAGLSGGWDTRAVVASLRAAGAAFSVRVTGRPDHYDVVIASELAKIAGLNLSVRQRPVFPPPTVEGLMRSISLALLWQAGYLPARKHKEFLASGRYLSGVVNIMGEHGEIGRGYFAKRIRAHTFHEAEHEERLIMRLMARMPSFMRASFHEPVRESIREGYRAAGRYGHSGLAQLDMYYLCETTRRSISGSVNAAAGVVFAPFLNPDYIRATFAYRGAKEHNPFHRYIIASNAPDWVEVPYVDDLREARLSAGEADPPARQDAVARANWMECTGVRNYNDALYWQDVGAPLIREALAREGLWVQLFEPALAQQRWHESADRLAMIHLLPLVLARSSCS